MMPHLIISHSYYSLLEGVRSPAEMAVRAAEIGCTALALCDHNLLTGAVEFALACRKAGIRPVFGLEVDIELDDQIGAGYPIPRIMLLAVDETGWSNLCRLSSLINLEGGRPLTLDEIGEHAKGLICLTGGEYGIFNLLLRAGNTPRINQLAGLLTGIFPHDFYFQICASPHLLQEETTLAELVARVNLPTALVPDARYLDASDEPLHRLVCAIRHNITVEKVTNNHGYAQNSAFPTRDELDSIPQKRPLASQNALEIQQRCQFQIPFGIPRFPRLSLPAKQSAAETLRQKAYQGAARIYGEVTPQIQQRLEYELNIISGMGYEPIFLIMEELLSYARRHGILFSSRGSAASSLVAHCLGITSPDPMRLSLYFERFLNPARSIPPDIDTDIDSRRRDEIIQHCFDVYGAGQVAMVATINRFRPRSAVGDAAKALGFSPSEARKIAAEMPHFFFTGRLDEEAPAGENSLFKALADRHPEPEYRQLANLASRLMGIPRHLSVHPGGLVISPGPMTDLVPVMKSSGKGVQISQFDLESLAYLGLVKIDLLGIRGLTVLADVATAIHSWRRADFDTPIEILEAIPADDRETGQTVASAKTIGCFQIESPGMRSTLKSIRARSPDDIMAALALYRPGPLRGGLRDAFIRRHNGEEPVSHLHPSLEATLNDTCGVILYQEQVLRIAHEIGGMTLAESDMLRRAMSHFDPGRQMQTLKEKFIRGAGESHAIPQELAEQIWEMMAAFSGYGFPKAHAASYAQIAWNSAWCKTHSPAEFMAAVLANWGGYYSQRVYLLEARRLGYAPRPPHINYSDRECTVVYQDGEPVLYLGLDQVKDLRSRTIEKIIHYRPFTSLGDFLSRVAPGLMEARNLIRCGGLTGMGTIPSLLAQLDQGPPAGQQLSLFVQTVQPNLEEVSLLERLSAQEEILGVGVEAHPLDIYAEKLRQFNIFSTVEALEGSSKKVIVAGVRQSLHRSRTSGGEMMAFLTLEDFEGTLDVILFPGVYRKMPREAISGNYPLLVEGWVEMDPGSGEPYLRAERVELLK